MKEVREVKEVKGSERSEKLFVYCLRILVKS